MIIIIIITKYMKINNMEYQDIKIQMDHNLMNNIVEILQRIYYKK